jgi:hypothetical protein
LSLGETFIEAMRLWDKLKAEGMSRDDRLQILEKTIRAAWPQMRQEPWHFHCNLCGDTGWRHKVCTASARCGRPFTLPKQSGDDWTGRGRCGEEHTYMEPCLCEKGRQFRANLLKERRDGDDAIAMAAKANKQPTRFGR